MNILSTLPTHYEQQRYSMFSQRNHPHRISIPDSEVMIYRKYSSEVLLPQYYRHALNCALSVKTIRDSKTILDVAGGTGEMLLYFAKFLPLLHNGVMLDLSEGAVQLANQLYTNCGYPLTAVQADMHNLPYDDDCFDTVIIHDSIHHSTDPERAIREAYRVAKHNILISDIQQYLPDVEVGKHLDRINQAFLEDPITGHIMKERFLESCQVTYPIEDVIALGKVLGLRLLSINKEGLNYVVLFEV